MNFHPKTTSSNLFHPSAFLFAGVGLYLFSCALRDTQGFDTTVLFLYFQLAPLLYSLITRKVSYFLFWSLSNFLFNGTDNLNDLLTMGTRFKAEPTQIASMFESVICYVIVLQFYLISRALIRPRSTELKSFFEISLPKKHLVIATLIVISNHFITSYLPASLIHPYELLKNFCLIVCLTSKCHESTKYPFIVRSIIFVSAIFDFINSGFLWPLGYVISIYALSNLLQKKTRVLLVVSFGVIALLLLQPIKAAYRNIIWGASDSIDTFDKLEALVELSTDQRNHSNQDALKSTILNRLDEDTLTRVMIFTPRFIPFWNGKTYETALFAFIPRAIWPDKPRQDWGNSFGRLYRVLLQDDYATSITCGYFPEGYINFGYTGLYTVAMVIGILLALSEGAAQMLLQKNFLISYLAGVLPFIGELSMGQLLNNLIAAFILMIATSFYLSIEKSSARRATSFANQAVKV